MSAMTITYLQLIQREPYTQRGIIEPNPAQRPQRDANARELADALGPFVVEDDGLRGWSPFTHVVSFDDERGNDRVYYLARIG